MSVFLAGDAGQSIRDAVMDALNGLGTGSLRESFDAVVTGGGFFCVSSMSSKARGVIEAGPDPRASGGADIPITARGTCKAARREGTRQLVFASRAGVAAAVNFALGCLTRRCSVLGSRVDRIG